MTTQEVANRYCELAKQNKWPQILDELCSPDLVNQEPEHVMARGIAVTTKGLDAIKLKAWPTGKRLKQFIVSIAANPW